MDDLLETLKEAIVKIDIEGVGEICERVLKSGIPASTAIEKAMVEGMNIVGQKFQDGEYYLVDLIAAGEAMQAGLKILGPNLTRSERKMGEVVLGTVEGDLHSIGKDVVETFLKAAGFDVVDLGEDVPAGTFVETVRTNKPAILGMSALITPTMPEMSRVINGLKRTALRKQVKIIVGGAPLSREYAERIGADAYAQDAIAGVNMCKDWVSRGSSR